MIKKLDSRKHVINFILAIGLGTTFLYLGLIVTFFLLNLLPVDPALLILGPGPFTMPEYLVAVEQLGLNDPLFFRFLRYLFEFLSGDWGFSYTVWAGAPVNVLLKTSVPHTIELLILPLCIGIILGRVFGRLSNRTKRKRLKGGIQLLSAAGIAAPVFFFGMFLQFTLGYLIPLFPTTGYKTYSYPTPPSITGFLIFDSLISGNAYLAIDVLYHYALPSIVLTVAITALMTRLFSSKMVKDSYKKKTILSNTAKTSVAFGVILTYLILIDVTFGLYGFGFFFINAIRNFDFFLIRGFLFVFIILFAITLITSNLIFSLRTLLKDRKPPQEELEDAIEREPNLSLKEEIKNYVTKIVHSPLAIIGLVAVLIPIFIAIFPELVSGHTFEDAFGIYINQWGPPSSENPLGQTKFGRDVLTLIAFGTRDSLIFGLGAILIGLIGGLAIGLLASKFNRIAHTITMSITLIFYILPGILLVLLLINTAGAFGVDRYGFLMFMTGLLLIPGFTRIIANTEFRIVSMGKKIISYLPLFAGFAILFYVALGFLGYSYPLTVQLGDLVSEGRVHLYDAPWASLWPGLIAFLIVTSLFILHEGLVKHSR